MEALPPIAILLLAALVAHGSDVQAALADRSRFPESEWGYLYYLTLSECDPERRAELKAAIKLMVASTSQQPVVERCTPRDVTDTLLRLDLRDLHWRHQDWLKVLAAYPYDYTGHGNPLLVRADWLLVTLADGTESDAYLRLLYGGDKIPETRAEFLKLHDVCDAGEELDPLRFGLIEAESGVAKQETRWIESFPTRSLYYFATRDVLAVQPEFDPLENPLGDFKHDGEEHIAALAKVHLGTGVRGTLQAYALFNGDGNRVDAAPVDLVEDSTSFRGNREIVSPGSCIQCHRTGLNDPSSNDYRRLIADGVDVYAYQETQERLEAFHLGQVQPFIEECQEDYESICTLVTGLSADESARAFRRAVDEYDRALTIEDVARELGHGPRTVTLALGFYLQPGKSRAYPARLAGLAHGRTMPRDTWEASAYHQAEEIVESWSRN